MSAQVKAVQKEFSEDILSLTRLIGKMRSYSSSSSILDAVDEMDKIRVYVQERIQDELIEEKLNAREARS